MVVRVGWMTPRALLGVLILAGCGQEPAPILPEKEPPTAVFETTKGRFAIEVDAVRAPKTADYFVRHVRVGFYDGLAFHRVIAQSIVQTGRMTDERKVRRTMSPSVESEADNGLKNRRGAVALARVTGRPHSGNTQFFVNLIDNPVLDFTEKTTDRGWGYTVFGRVVEGMTVVDAIGRVAVDDGPRQFWPLEPIVIDTSYMMKVESPVDTTGTESDEG